MRILVTNDDGIYAPGLWALVKELTHVAEVVVVAPDREQSAVGTAVTLHQPLRVQKMNPDVPGVLTFATSGTPGDSVILGLSKLVKDKVDLVVSGINPGPNVGDDVLISGTVGGALLAYLHGVSAMAVSIDDKESRHVENAARIAATLAKRIGQSYLGMKLFLNVNVPDEPMSAIKGVRVTRVGNPGFADTVEDGHDGRRHYYWLVHHMIEKDGNEKTDVWALNQRYISITPLHTNYGGKNVSISNLCYGFMKELPHG